MMIKVGDVFWKVSWSEEGHELEEWRVRTIRRAPRRSSFWNRDEQPLPLTVYFVLKINGITWVKKSKKNFDYGWDVNIDDLYRKSQTLDEYTEKGPPYGLRTTKLQAYNFAIKDCENSIKRWKKDDPDDVKFISQLKKTLTSMRSRRSKIRSK